MFHRNWSKTLTATVYAEKKFETNQDNRKDIYVHAIHWSFKPTNWAELDGGDPDIFISFQITTHDQSAIIPLGSACIYKEEIMMGNIGAGVPVETTVIPTTGYIQFNKAIRIPGSKAYWCGVYSDAAGLFSIRLMVSEKDV